MKKRILFIMSDTGGGHRAAAEALRDALYIKYGEENIDAELLDMFKAGRFPANYMPEFYPWIINHGKTQYGISYNLSNTRRRADVLARTIYYTNARRFKKMAQNNPADVVVCVHSVLARPALRAFETLPERPPFITVVTDLVSTHAFWYDQRAELTMVPTQGAFDRGLKSGLLPDKMTITGLPVHPHFIDQLGDKAEARAELGWHPDKITILMVAGGEGMGPLYETARAIDRKNLDCQLVIVTGRNQQLKMKLEESFWRQPTHVYPFVTNMPQLMTAADMIVTKAGPATVTEAAVAGLPMILSDAIPGQEDGNVQYVLENEAGAYAPNPAHVADVVAEWIGEGRESLRQRSANASRIARPNAVWDIADEIMRWSDHGMVPASRTSLWESAIDLVPIP